MKSHLQQLRDELGRKGTLSGQDAARIVDTLLLVQAELEVLLERVQLAEGRLAPEPRAERQSTQVPA